MAREGREAELVLKELESLSLGGLGEIQSPDHILDVVTGKPREVDVSIRVSVGTHNFLTVIECRDRTETQDVTWIEQIITKTKDIKANKVIAVSTSGFTEGAKLKAEHNNIILRTLEEFDANETIEWFEGTFIELRRFDVRNMNIILVNEIVENTKSKLVQIESNLDPNEKIIFIENIGEYFNFVDIVKRINYDKDDFLFRDLEANKPPVRRIIKVKIKENHKHFIKIKNEKHSIDKIELDLLTWVEKTSIPLHKALKYKEGQEALLDKLDYKFTIINKEFYISIVQDHKTRNQSFKGHVVDLNKN